MYLGPCGFITMKGSGTQLKVPMKGNFLFFYCDSTLGCPVIQDFDLCKLD